MDLFTNTSQPYPISALITPSLHNLTQMWPIFASVAMMLALYLARIPIAGNGEVAYLRFGAFQKRRVSEGQWWRVFTYAFVYRSGRQLLIDAAAIVLFGLVITQLSSFSLAFATFRLGLFVPLLVFVFSTPADRVITSVSGSAYSMAGTLLVVVLLNWQRWTLLTTSDALAGVALLVIAVLLCARLKFAPDTAPITQHYAFTAGIGAALVATIVAFVTT